VHSYLDSRVGGSRYPGISEHPATMPLKTRKNQILLRFIIKKYPKRKLEKERKGENLKNY